MFTLLISVIIILAVLLVLVILAQDSKGGVGAAFGGSASQIMGVTKTGNILEKSTWVLSIAILVLSLSSAAFYSTSTGDDFRSPNVENARRQVVSPSFGEGEGLLPSNTEEQQNVETPIDVTEEDGSED
ncbi:preprotein translocase subunit SecG [Arthrospiribacter ruber]|uniref:Protein-export membrane protein SecG n=1 Tax=Arthrospiribacter ruber TaxID=2487934 RepID=A0A951IVN6_9BACT|nr:preprotein translocase subunit SecG [Arthrospiribacter ruber]MBW3466443.1 preprotein translocase subunit SecG [Arthrospiribacter ruber]